MVKVAIVDAEPDLQRLYKLALASRGHDILYIASDGVEAIKKNRNTPAQIIIMGNYMPTKNGLEATREILAEQPHTKIIMTAASDTIEQEAYEAGAVRFLKKPVSLKDLISTIDEVALETLHGPGSREDRVLTAKVPGPREDRVIQSIRRLEQMDNRPGD